MAVKPDLPFILVLFPLAGSASLKERDKGELEELIRLESEDTSVASKLKNS